MLDCECQPTELYTLSEARMSSNFRILPRVLMLGSEPAITDLYKQRSTSTALHFTEALVNNLYKNFENKDRKIFLGVDSLI